MFLVFHEIFRLAVLKKKRVYRKRNLLKRKDKQEAANREEESKRKMLIQDALRSSNRQKITKAEK